MRRQAREIRWNCGRKRASHYLRKLTSQILFNLAQLIFPVPSPYFLSCFDLIASHSPHVIS
jgi:hypothetical protein